MLVLFAMVAVQAQNLLSEDFEGGVPSTWVTVDADGDGSNWDVIGMPGHNSDGCVTSKSYDNNIGALTPDNWLITPAVNLTADAVLTFWVCAQDASWPSEHYGVYISTTASTTPSDFTLIYEETIDANGGPREQGVWKQKTVNLSSYTGQTIRIAFRHFNCTDMFYIDLDDVVIFSQPTTPTISPSSTNLDFGTIMLGSTADATVNVVTYNLTANVTATTAAPYSVSANGTSFGTTATIPAAGGTLYVRFTPTAVGDNNGTITLASAGAPNVTINLTGNGLDCGNTPIPYHFDFNNAGVDCWTIVDNNNDGSTFNFDTEQGFAYYMYSETNDADDWLISPVFNMNGDYHGSVDYTAYSSSYPERFQIFLIGPDNSQVALTGEIDATVASFQTLDFNISSVNGNYKIGIHAISDADSWALLFTNFNLEKVVGINDIDNEAKIYPNPANNVLNINANSNINNVSVYNMMGKLVGSYNVNDVNTQISTTSLANGVYTVRISTENGMMTKKFTVAR